MINLLTLHYVNDAGVTHRHLRNLDEHWLLSIVLLVLHDVGRVLAGDLTKNLEIVVFRSVQDLP